MLTEDGKSPHNLVFMQGHVSSFPFIPITKITQNTFLKFVQLVTHIFNKQFISQDTIDRNIFKNNKAEKRDKSQKKI